MTARAIPGIARAVRLIARAVNIPLSTMHAQNGINVFCSSKMNP